MNKRLSSNLLLVVLFIFALLVGGKFPYVLLFIILLVHVTSFMTVRKNCENIVGIFWCSHETVEKGVEIEIDYKLYNSGFFPFAYMEVKDQIPKKLYKDGQKERVVFMKPYDTARLKKTFKCRHRGYYDIGQLDIEFGDIFGLFSRKHILRDELNVTVYPKVYPLKHFNIVGREFFGSATANQKYYEDYSSIKTLRPYGIGDSLKRVHWKTTARKGEMYVKNYEISANLKAQIFMDLQVDKYLDDMDQEVEEKVVECVVSLVHHLLFQNIDMNLVTYTNEKVTLHGKETNQFSIFLEMLTRVKPLTNIPLGGVILSEMSMLPMGTTLIIVTPKVDGKIKRAMLTLKNKGYAIVLILVGDLNHNKVIKEDLAWIEQVGIRTYAVDLEDDITKVLR